MAVNSTSQDTGARLGPIAYLTGEYPRATDTFIQREVAALREHGLEVFTCSIRRSNASHLVGHEQRQEAARTFHVLETVLSPLSCLKAHARILISNPRRYAQALALAISTGRPGVRGLAYQFIYFIEAIVLADFLRQRGITHLHNHIAKSSCSVAMLASTALDIPYSFTVHGPDIFFEPMAWRLDAKIERAKFVACISNFCRSQAMVFARRADWSKLHIVHCGVELERYADPPPEDAAKIPYTGPLRALFVGRLASVKGVPILLEALDQIKREAGQTISLTLIGDGPERPRLEHEAVALGLQDQTHFLGYKSQADVAEALRAHDLLVLPSFAEGLPVVLMEAMASRKPVVSTRVAGIPELVEDKVNGLLVSPGSVEELRQALVYCIENRERLEGMGVAGYEKIAEGFDVRKEAKRLAGLIGQD